ncbi:MAG: glycosyltransferase family 4 protein [Candidatus Norongarragalinales archaeon]
MYVKLYIILVVGMRFLILGSKEYPVGASRGFDLLPSGGMERYTQDLAAALAAKGEKPLVVTRKFPGQKSFEEKNGVSVRRVGWLNGFLLRNPSFNFNSLRESMRLDFDVVFANGVMATLAGLALRFFKRTPVIARPAGVAWVQPQYNFFVKTLLNAMEKTAYSHADAVVFLSDEEVKSFEKKMGFLPKRYRVINTGVNLEGFKIVTRKTARKSGQKKVLFLGRLLPVKGAKFLVEAASGVPAEILIAGEGPEKPLLQKTVAEKNLNNVKFLGQVKNPEKLLAECDIFVLPSLSEGLPIAMLEAFASKKPCVVTDIGLPVENGKTALVVKPGDAKALALALNHLLANPRLSKRLADNAFRMVSTKFTWKKAAKEIISLAESLERR